MKHVRYAFGKWLLFFCFMSLTGHIYAKQRYYCEVKGIEKELSSGLKIIFDFRNKSFIQYVGRFK